MFKENFILGFDHIFSLNGYSHFLFLLVFWVVYSIKDWRRLLVMLTAFTFGHGLAFLLFSKQISYISPYWIELFIPVSISLASIQNLVRLKDHSQSRLSLYPLAISFALINGLGFINTYRSQYESEQDISIPLFAFNVGIEFGQICMLTGFVMTGYLLNRMVKFKHKTLIITISILTLILSLYMVVLNI